MTINPKSKLILLLFLLVCYSTVHNYAQQKSRDDGFTFMFYNLENLFDAFDDSTKQDDEFLPEGGYHWTYTRMQEKIRRIYKVIVAAGNGDLPDVIGVCEFENSFVLKQLVQETPLLRFDYQYVHYDSPDRRGIDVGMLYRPDKFKVITSRAIPVSQYNEPAFVTRDILYVKGVAANHDTLHVFVNHWPSRWGGQAVSEPKRIAAASMLRQVTDSIQNVTPDAKIVITGDFNDTPSDRSLQHILISKSDPETGRSNLINLSESACRSTLTGSIKFQGEWACFDQFIVSPSLMQRGKGLYTSDTDFSIFSPAFLSEPDESYSGAKPFRTFIGRRYHGGYSDHYPVLLELKLLSK